MSKVTSKDIARIAGVSQTAVSIALNNNYSVSLSEETRKRIIKTAREYKYGPFAHPSDFDLPNEIAVFTPSLTNPFYPMILDYIQQALYAEKYHLCLYCTDKSEQKEIEQLQRAQGARLKAILYTFTPQATELVSELVKRYPICILGEADTRQGATIVALNSQKAGYIMAEHLYDLGHRNIAYISNPINTLSFSRKRRLDGIMQFAHDKNFQSNIKVLMPDTEDASEFDVGYKMTLKLIDAHPEVTAIIGANDITAIGILNALRDRQISVPEDISVSGFDNVPMSENIYPKLTTIDHCLPERTEHAINMLLCTKKTGLHITYDPLLLQRGSTGPNKRVQE